MLLVVFMHFDEMFYARFATWDVAEDAWDTLSSAARPARIPAFFLISGILAAPALKRSWRAIVEKRIAIQYYTFALWSFIHVFTLYALYTPLDGAALAELIPRYGWNLIWANSQVWFLWALVVFFLIALAFHKIPTIAVALAAVMFLAAEQVDDLILMQVLRSLVFFLAGCYFPAFAKRLGDRLGLPMVGALLLAYMVSVGAILLVGEKTFGIWLPATLFGVALFFQISTWLTSTPLVAPLSYVGRQTLPIYVMHGIILMVFSAISRKNDWTFGTSIGGRIGDAILPVVGNIAVVAACLGLYVLFRQIGLNWLFNPPERMIAALRGKPSREFKMSS